MVDKGKKGKDVVLAVFFSGVKFSDKKDEKVEEKLLEKKVEFKDEVGTRKGCRRYKWEFKDSNKEFWFMGYVMVKILSLVSWVGISGSRGCNKGERARERVLGGFRGVLRVRDSFLSWFRSMFFGRVV